MRLMLSRCKSPPNLKTALWGPPDFICKLESISWLFNAKWKVWTFLLFFQKINGCILNYLFIVHWHDVLSNFGDICNKLWSAILIGQRMIWYWLTIGLLCSIRRYKKATCYACVTAVPYRALNTPSGYVSFSLQFMIFIIITPGTVSYTIFS